MSFKVVLDEKRKSLMKEAINVQEKAYSPYSKFKVGAAILTKSGKIFTGCNIENVSYSMTICAERVAVFKAISEGHTDFEAIAISASSNESIYPCGACRQVLAEFNPKIEVFVNHDEKSYPLYDLLPKSFDQEQLNSKL
jgi:cytidine deaminase